MRSEDSISADASGSVTTIETLVSSAKSRMLEPMSVTMSLINVKKKKKKKKNNLLAISTVCQALG